MRVVVLMVLVVLLIGCKSEECRDSVEPTSVELEVDRLEKLFFEAESAEKIALLLNQYPDFARLFLDMDQYPSSSILADRMFHLFQNPSIDTLFLESVKAFEEFDGVLAELEESFGRLKVYYPNTSIPKIQTTVTGFYKDLIITQNHIMIGIDFFIGADATYKPTQIPTYILRRYDLTHLPANIMQFISSQYIQPSKGETMLAEMIDHGKSYYLLSKLLPCTPEHILIGYTEEEWQESFENDAIIWVNFIENKLLYETNHQMKQKFLGERPNVYEIGDKCPGRIGRWLGWQIVKGYMDQTGASINELMDETDANKVFSGSKYKPIGN